MKECIFQFFQSFHSIFPLNITADAQKSVSLAQPLSQVKTTMGNKNKTFPHTDGLPLFRSLFLSQNTLRTERAVFRPIYPSTTTEHPILASPTPLVKMVALNCGRSGDVSEPIPGYSTLASG